MLKAIRTKYLACTNTKPARIVAADGDGNRIILPFDSFNTWDEGSEAAARALVEKMQWNCDVRGGGFKNHDYWILVPTSGRYRCAICGSLESHPAKDPKDPTSHWFKSGELVLDAPPASAVAKGGR
jgi:hypothetical protein